MRWRAAAGVALLAVGCALSFWSFVALPWYRAGDGPYAPPYGGPAPRNFAELRAHFEIAGTGHEGAIYFGWLWWVLVVALVVIGVCGAIGVRWRGARWVAIGLGAVSAWVTYTAFSDIVEAGGSAGQRADVGLWVATIGYLVAGLGASIAQPRPFRRGQVSRDYYRGSREATP